VKLCSKVNKSKVTFLFLFELSILICSSSAQANKINLRHYNKTSQKAMLMAEVKFHDLRKKNLEKIQDFKTKYRKALNTSAAPSHSFGLWGPALNTIAFSI
jgi:hypothetical protein